MGRLIDSSVFIALERLDLPLSHLAISAPDEPLGLASITVSELLTGLHRAESARRQRQRAAFVMGVLEEIPILPFDLRVARVHAAVWARLAAAGSMIGAHDLIIAATALAHDFAIVTHNVREFDRVPGLVVQRPDW